MTEPKVTLQKGGAKIVALQNPDKEWHEEWYAGRHLANLPHPYRLCLIGRPNSGKGCVVQQLINHADPPFENIVVFHCCPSQTDEWNDIVLDPETDVVSVIPSLDSWDREKKNLLIIDDVDLAHLDKISKSTLDRTCGFTSTHNNLSVFILVQDLLQVKPNIRRMMTGYALWKVPDMDSMCVLARRTGIKRKWFSQIVKMLKSYHDHIFVDMSNNSPAPVRINLYNKVTIPEED